MGIVKDRLLIVWGVLAVGLAILILVGRSLEILPETQVVLAGLFLVDSLVFFAIRSQPNAAVVLLLLLGAFELSFAFAYYLSLISY